MTDSVLVTGGSGYLASWCIYELLRSGCPVRTTVRSAAKGAQVRAAALAGPQPVDIGLLSVSVADLTGDAGWAAAVDGCAYVLHTASPFPAREPKNPDELIVPAVEGTRRVVRAALAAGVSRIVLTSSSATVRHLAGSTPKDGVFDESGWTDVRDRSASTYARSKTLAEQAAWRLVEEHGDRAVLTTIGPGTMLGPLRERHIPYSMQAVSRLLDGSAPGIPNLGYSFVDVRDVVLAHLRAMTAPEAGGRRFLVAAEFRWLAEIAEILRAELGADADRVPTRRVPDVLVRLAALVDPSFKQLRGDLGRRSELRTDAARSTLDWEPRPIRQTVLDCAHSLLDRQRLDRQLANR